jgi:hypothetical protein
MMGESDTQKSKPPGPIIMMGGIRNTEKQSYQQNNENPSHQVIDVLTMRRSLKSCHQVGDSQKVKCLPK